MKFGGKVRTGVVSPHDPSNSDLDRQIATTRSSLHYTVDSGYNVTPRGMFLSDVISGVVISGSSVITSLLRAGDVISGVQELCPFLKY